MPVKINEVHTEVHAFDASALLTEPVMKVIIERVGAALAAQATADDQRAKDSKISDSRRVVD